MRLPDPEPIPMVLFCPYCQTQHIDAPEPRVGWDNPPHKSHLCHKCGAVWRPSSVPTTGVVSIPAGSTDRPPLPTKEGEDMAGKYVYSFVPAVVPGIIESNVAVYVLLDFLKTRVEMHFTEDEFIDFRGRLSICGVTLHEIERWPYIKPETVL